eukprot:CAMPEP_0185042038 /NCGR_PEP_ID=MMETSP1103-20130426/42074_1 /TAXON_ID=36769 /ORGANISM="Paraphysomonas bandaiensis, Strain Caron Lab Isolate" /LENGTH=1508 /DNA_ID=CAMNT_0027582027 /DNA_START=417 /DNA_END=4943 /DNA_ORIENTATION=-
MPPNQAYNMPPYGNFLAKGRGLARQSGKNYMESPLYPSGSHFGRSVPPTPPGAPAPYFQTRPPLHTEDLSQGQLFQQSGAAGRSSPQDVDMEIVDNRNTSPSSLGIPPVLTEPETEPGSVSAITSELPATGDIGTKFDMTAEPQSPGTIHSHSRNETDQPKSKSLICVVSDPSFTMKEDRPVERTSISTSSFSHTSPALSSHTIRTRPSSLTRSTSASLPRGDTSASSITDLIDTIHSGSCGSRTNFSLNNEGREERKNNDASRGLMVTRLGDIPENSVGASDMLETKSDAVCSKSARRARLGWGQGLRRRTSENMDSIDMQSRVEGTEGHSASEAVVAMPSKIVPLRRTQSDISLAKSTPNALLSYVSKDQRDSKSTHPFSHSTSLACVQTLQKETEIVSSAVRMGERDKEGGSCDPGKCDTSNDDESSTISNKVCNDSAAAGEGKGVTKSHVLEPPLLEIKASQTKRLASDQGTSSPCSKTRLEGRSGRQPSSNEAKALKTTERLARRKMKDNALIVSGIKKKSSTVSDGKFNSNSDEEGSKPKRKRIKKGMCSQHTGETDGDSEDATPKKRRGRPPASAVKVAEETVQGPKLSRSGRGGKSANSPPQSIPSLPAKRRSRSFGSFERDSLGSLFSRIPDLRNAYYALQGMVRIQVGIRGLEGFCKEDMQNLYNLLQNPHSVVNLPMPYTSEIMICLDILEAKIHHLGHALSNLLIWRKELEDSSAQKPKAFGRRKPKTVLSSPQTKNTSSSASNSTSDLTIVEPPSGMNNSPTHSSSSMALVKTAACKENAPKHPNSQVLWPEPLAPMFAKENSKRAAIANMSSHNLVSAFASPGDCAYPINQSRIYSLQQDMKRKRSIVALEVRRRKLARTDAWGILGNRYLRVKHQWEYYVEHHLSPEQEEDEIFTVRLQKLAAMKNVMSPRATSRLSTMRNSSSGSGDILHPEYDQENILKQLATMELMQRRLKTGVTTPTDMLSPWQNADSTVAPEPPRWPPEGLLIGANDPMGSVTEPQDISSLQNTEAFPVSVVEPPIIVDLNGCRLTTDGRRQQCCALTLSQECRPGCNCALQVDKFERECRPWTDMEKCIFLDKFLQFPKNFSKIASYLTNRTTKDCIKFYYDSKTTIPYKSLLREFDNRKRHVKNSWLHSRTAALSVGGIVYPPDEFEDKEQLYELPENDVTYGSLCSHPRFMAAALGFERKEQEEIGAARRKHMKYMQEKEPRPVTRLLADRRYLRKLHCELEKGASAVLPPYLGGNRGIGSKKFVYASDHLKDTCTAAVYGGYGQGDAEWQKCRSDQMYTRTKRAQELSNDIVDIGGLKDIKSDCSTVEASLPVSPAAGRGRRGRRLNSTRGGGRGGGRDEVEISDSEKPICRGKGRGKGRWGGRGRGRGKGRPKSSPEATDSPLQGERAGDVAEEIEFIDGGAEVLMGAASGDCDQGVRDKDAGEINMQRENRNTVMASEKGVYGECCGEENLDGKDSEEDNNDEILMPKDRHHEKAAGSRRED